MGRKISKFQWFFKVLQRWKFSNFGLIGSRSGSRRRKGTDAHFSCVLLTGNKSRKSEVGVLQVKRPKITKIQVRNRKVRNGYERPRLHIESESALPAVGGLIKKLLICGSSSKRQKFAEVSEKLKILNFSETSANFCHFDELPHMSDFFNTPPYF